MATLQENMQDMRHRRKNSVKRDDLAYEQALSLTVEELHRLLTLYRDTVFVEDMRARLLRDAMDHWIRRYQGYSIQGRFKSHYCQRGVSLAAKDTIFEHVIPAAVVRDKLILGQLTINQALNIPTCRVARNTDAALRTKGLHDNTPDGWFFFKRYHAAVPDIGIETYNGQIIQDLDAWTLQDHFNFFGIKE